MCPLERIYWICLYVNAGGKGHMPPEIKKFILKYSYLLLDTGIIRAYINAIHEDNPQWKTKGLPLK